MKLYLWVLPLAILLQGCLEVSSFEYVEPEPDYGYDAEDVDDQQAGDVITSLVIVVAAAVNGDYPVAAKVEMRGALSAVYELRLNDALVESGTLPDAIAETPGLFSDEDTEDNYRITYVTLESGDNEIELTLTKDGVTETRAFSRTIGSQCTGENENWYASYAQSNFNNTNYGNCASCHGLDYSSFSSLSTWNVISSGDDDFYYVANKPALFDATPDYDSDDFNDPYSHSGGEQWSVDSADHYRTIEMLYRMDTDFSCS